MQGARVRFFGGSPKTKTTTPCKPPTASGALPGQSVLWLGFGVLVVTLRSHSFADADTTFHFEPIARSAWPSASAWPSGASNRLKMKSRVSICKRVAAKRNNQHPEAKPKHALAGERAAGGRRLAGRCCFCFWRAPKKPHASPLHSPKSSPLPSA